MIRIPRLPLVSNRLPQRFSARQSDAGDESFKVVKNEQSADTVEVLLYDEIGFWGVTAKDFILALANINAGTIHLRINSPGGDAFDGVAMHNALKRHSARVIVTVDALAASAASVVAMAGDEIRMNQGSFLMVHRAWTGAIGNCVEMREIANVLEKVDGSIADFYAGRTGGTADAMLKLMDDETWLDADEAVAQKFADDVSDQPAAKAAFDLSIFDHAPDTLVAAGKQKKTPRELEALLRDEAGLSNSAAKRVAAIANSQTRLRDEDLSSLGEVFRSHRS